MKTITLSKPFKLQDGREITEFQLNFEELSTADFRQIRKLEALVSNAESVSLMDAVNDKELSLKKNSGHFRGRIPCFMVLSSRQTFAWHEDH